MLRCFTRVLLCLLRHDLTLWTVFKGFSFPSWEPKFDACKSWYWVLPCSTNVTTCYNMLQHVHRLPPDVFPTTLGHHWWAESGGPALALGLGARTLRRRAAPQRGGKALMFSARDMQMMKYYLIILIRITNHSQNIYVCIYIYTRNVWALPMHCMFLSIQDCLKQC